MTNGEVISLLRNSIKEVTSDSIYTNRFLYNTLRVNAFMYLERERKSLSNLNIFTTKTIDTEEVNLYEDSCVPLDCKGCRIKLPVISTKIGPLYKFIASADMSQEWKLVNPLSFVRKNKMKSRYNYAYLDGDYAYFTDCPECVKVCFASSDLEEGTSDSCSRLEDEFFLPDHLLTYVIQDSLRQIGALISKAQDHIQNKSTLS